MPDKESSDSVEIIIDYQVSPDMRLQYPTNFTAQHTEREFIISFFEVTPPIVLGTPEEVGVAFSKIDKVPAHCLARFAIHPARMAEFIGVLIQNHQTYLAKFTQPEGATDES